jgi:hypothetical protein
MFLALQEQQYAISLYAWRYSNGHLPSIYRCKHSNNSRSQIAWPAAALCHLMVFWPPPPVLSFAAAHPVPQSSLDLFVPVGQSSICGHRAPRARTPYIPVGIVQGGVCLLVALHSRGDGCDDARLGAPSQGVTQQPGELGVSARQCRCCGCTCMCACIPFHQPARVFFQSCLGPVADAGCFWHWHLL